ncbi:MAG: BTAD domain-containing putative transcriptional regulator [Actinomycetota bacterium]
MDSLQGSRDHSTEPAGTEAGRDDGRSGIRTFLIADIRGYTTFTQERGDEAAGRLAARFAATVREEVESRDGTLVEIRGDEVLVEFGSPRQAIRSAVELQSRFLRETVGSPDMPLPVGIGLDAGEAVIVEGGYRGGALNTAARLCANARAGEILGTRSVVHLARSVEGVRYLDRGEVRLKGLADPVGVLAIASTSTDVVEEMRAFGAKGPARSVYRGAMRFRLLGPLEVDAGTIPVPLGGPKQRAVLAHLLLRPNQLVPSETLIDELWGDEPPETARNTVQTYVSHLRKALGEGRLLWRPPGYMLTIDPSELDSSSFDDLLREAKKALAVDPKLAVSLYDDALALWRGPALADVAAESSLLAEAARLDDLRLAAQEDRVHGLLASGQATRAVGETEALLARHPLRERLWGQLMLALYREGRQADALGSFQRAREILAGELGIDPSPELARLQERILRQDPELDLRGEPLRGYRLMEKIGEGPTGVVFRGLQPRVGRDVAVKVLHERLVGDGAFIRRFEPEAQAVAALEHPHIAPVYDYWRDPAGAYVVTRYLRGGSLRALEERGEPIDPKRRKTIVHQIAAALAFAHRQGVAHGSVRASNVAFDGEGNAYLCDFRIATGPLPTVEDDLEQLTAIARRLLGDAPDGSDVLQLIGVGADAPGAAGLAEALSSDGVGPAVATSDIRNPYKGLRPFAEADAGDFFGRNELIGRLLGRLRENAVGSRFLAVVGPSGSGKSSVVRAGLVPAIRGGALPGPDAVVIELFPRIHPFEELEEAILRVAARPIARLRDRLESGSRGFLETMREALPSDTRVVVVVDQFEELFTLTTDEQERELFLESLRVAAVDAGSTLTVIVTLRADFFDRPLGYQRFGELLGMRTESVPPLTPDELEQAIRGPAERVGVRARPGLTAEMVADVASQPGALPLLQYALTELFERRDGDALGVEAYLALGGVAGALSTRAERLFEASGADGRRATRQVLLRLVTLGEGRQDTRRRVVRSDLDVLDVEPAAVDAVLDAFGRHRLLTFDREPSTREPTVEIAHEALLTSWQRLRGWIDEAREDLRFERQVAQGAAEWRASGRDASFLLRGTRLDRAVAWVESTDLAFGQHERMFVTASTHQRELERSQEEERRAREQRIEHRSRSRLRALVGVLTAAALVASALTVIAVRQTDRAQREVRSATARELAAASLANLDVDPERSILLALQAVATTLEDGITLREAEEALHRAVQADRLLMEIRHPSTANVDWSPDGQLVLTGGTWGGQGQNDALLWDADSGDLVRTLSEHAADIDTVAFNHDGSRAATTSSAPDNRTIVWDTETGEALLRLPGLGDWTLGASFSPDGERLALVDDGGDGGRLRIVDIGTGEERVIPSGGGPWCYPVFSSDGFRIALGACHNGHGVILDATTGLELVEVGEENEVVGGLAFSPDGSRLTGTRSGGIQAVWDARTGKQLFLLDAGGVTGFAFSADGTKIATGGVDGTARIWDAKTGEELLALSGHQGTIGLVDFSHDGTRLLTGGIDGTARIWDITPTGGAEWPSIAETPNWLSTVDFVADGTRLVVGEWVVRSSTGDRLVRFDPLESGWHDADVSPDGSTVVVSNESGAYVMSTSTGQLLRPLRQEGFVWSVAYSPDGSMIATGIGADQSDESTVVLWDAATGAELASFGGPDRPGDAMEGVAFSPDGAMVAGVQATGRLRAWGVASGDRLLSVGAHTGVARDVAFSPDGRSIATAGGDGAAIWSVATGDRVAAMGGAGSVYAVAFSPDGTRLATAGHDRTVRLWDVDGRETLTLIGAGDAVRDVAFSPDGRRLAATSQDGVMRLYILPIGDLVSLARRRLTRTFTATECLQYLHVDRCPAEFAGLPTGPDEPAHPLEGPAGAFRVEVSRRDLLAEGFPELAVPDWVGTYTWSLSNGTYRIHREAPSGDAWDAVGTYEVSGDRLVFTDRADDCFGSTWSIGWSLGGTLSFADPSPSVTSRWCPVGFDSLVRAVFLSRPWARVAGASSTG